MWKYNYTNELMHYGVLGMKWGVRRSRGHAGPGVFLGSKKRRLAGAKKDLEILDNGGRLSVGLTKKRQRALNERDRSALNKKISSLESEINKKAQGKPKKAAGSEDHVRAKSLKKKKLSELSNAELRDLNNRMQLESQYKSLKKQNVSAGKKFFQDVAYEAAKSTAASYAKKYAKKGIDATANILSDAIKEQSGRMWLM